MIRINATLLSKLLIDPTPQPKHPEVAQIYKSLFSRMYPGEQDFKEFLQAQNYDKQYELAERIVHHLCYASNFPPTYFALKDIICLEGYQKETVGETSVYVPRDHFVHLVNLYLLGIYVFFYNAEFYQKITADNRYERESDLHNQSRYDCVKDFVSEWKYFCLFHDVGYTQEIFGNKQYVKNANRTYTTLCKRVNDFQSSFVGTNAVKQNAFFGTIEIMSRILTWELIKDYSTDIIDVNHKMLRYFQRSDVVCINCKGHCETASFNDDIAPLITEFQRIEKIYSNQCLKPLLPIIGEKNIVVVGIHKNTGEVAFLSFERGMSRQLFFLRKYEKAGDIQRLIADPSLILFDDYKPVEFDMEYLVQTETADTRFYETVLFDESSVKYTLDYIKKTNIGMDFAGITSENQLLDFYFKLYLFLYGELRKFIVPGKEPKQPLHAKQFDNFLDAWDDIFSMDTVRELEQSSKVNALIFKLLQASFTDDIKSECINYIREISSIKKSRGKGTTTSSSSDLVADIVEQYFSAVSGKLEDTSEKKRLIDTIAANYSKRIEQAKALLTIYAYTYSGLKSIFEKGTMFAYSFDYCKRTETFNLSVNDLLEQKCQTQLKKDYNKIVTSYSGGFSKFDHGFSSAKYAAATFNLLRESISSKKTPKEWMLIDILFSISNPYKDNNYIAQYITNYNHIFRNTLYAIFIHNVYPTGFKDETLRKMKTSISDPFTYLALICDSLQQWNRPQSISPSLLDLRPSEHASEEYNIIVESDGIYLYEQGVEQRQTRLASYINGMSHLDNVKAYVKNGFVMTNKQE